MTASTKKSPPRKPLEGLNLLVPKAGLEPARLGKRLILSQVRLPIPPLRHVPIHYSAKHLMPYRTCNIIPF